MNFLKIQNIGMIKSAMKKVRLKFETENIIILSENEYNEMMKAKRNAEYLAMIG